MALRGYHHPFLLLLPESEAEHFHASVQLADIGAKEVQSEAVVDAGPAGLLFCEDEAGGDQEFEPQVGSGARR